MPSFFILFIENPYIGIGSVGAGGAGGAGSVKVVGVVGLLGLTGCVGVWRFEPSLWWLVPRSVEPEKITMPVGVVMVTAFPELSNFALSFAFSLASALAEPAPNENNIANPAATANNLFMVFSSLFFLIQKPAPFIPVIAKIDSDKSHERQTA